MEALFIYNGNSYVLNRFMKSDSGLFTYIESLMHTYNIKVIWSPTEDQYEGNVYRFNNLHEIADIIFDIRRVS